jgi:hypothetical protein
METSTAITARQPWNKGKLVGPNAEVRLAKLPAIKPPFAPPSLPAAIRSMPTPRRHSVMMRSAHSTSETKIVGLPNFAPHCARSASVTPRAREHAPHAKI